MIQFANSGNVYIQFNRNVNLVPVIVVGPTMQTLKFLTLTPPSPPRPEGPSPASVCG